MHTARIITLAGHPRRREQKNGGFHIMTPWLSIRSLLACSMLLLTVMTSHNAYALTPAQLFEQVNDSVVVIKVYDGAGKAVGQGSGVILSSGEVATNCHVLEHGARYEAGRGKTFQPAEWTSGDTNKDLCLLSVSNLTGKPVRHGKASRLKVGDPVYAVGSPKGLELSLSDGIVSQLRGGTPPIIQTTAAISPGSSGGGLFNAEGELVGITTFYLAEGQSLNFAVPAEWLDALPAGNKTAAKTWRSLDWLARGALLEEKKDWQRLRDLMQQWTRAEPSNPDAWSALGHTYRYMNRHQDASKAYREALRLKPDYANAWYGLGRTYHEMNRYQDAVEAYREALRLEPDYDYWYSLGRTYNALNRHQDAIKANRESLRLKPDYAYAWHSLGIAYRKMNLYQDAIEAYREALRLKPDLANAWYNLGVAYSLHGDRAKALEAARTLRRYDPTQADKLLNIITSK